MPDSSVTVKPVRLLHLSDIHFGAEDSEALAAVEQFASHVKPDAIIIAGDITPEAGFALAESALGAWAKPTTPPAPAVAAGAALPPRALTIDMPKIGQAVVFLGRVGPARMADDYFPTVVANNVLGGGYSARLNAEIRIKRGLSYGANSGLTARKQPGPITALAQTRNDAVPDVVDLMVSEFARLGSEPIPANELAARKAVIVAPRGSWLTSCCEGGRGNCRGEGARVVACAARDLLCRPCGDGDRGEINRGHCASSCGHAP